MGSTYSYLSVSRLADVERSTGVTFRWRPFQLLIILQEMKHVPFADKPTKSAYMCANRPSEIDGFARTLPQQAAEQALLPLHAAGAYQLRRRRNDHQFSWSGDHRRYDEARRHSRSQRLVYGDRRHVTWLNAFVTPILSGSAVASTAFCACSTSCLVCSVTAWI